MENQIKNHVQLLFVAALLAFSLNVAFGDDLNAPDYRGDPLSVHAHWQNLAGGPILDLIAFSSVDDTDPTTTLFPAPPTAVVTPTADKDYEFYLPNFIDELPVKYMRLQLTWQFVPTSPTSIDISGVEGTTGIPGTIVSSSAIINVAPELYYQYYDIEFYPNPDQERWTVFLEDNAQLVQVVADTVSTIPEPSTMAILGFGALTLFRKRK